MRKLILMLSIVVVGFAFVGCASSKPDGPTSLHEWGEMSRPKL